MRPRTRALLSVSKQHVLDCGDGVRLMGMHSSHANQSRPLVVIMHGWEGSADSLYVLSLGSHLFAEGFDIFRLNFRDHGPTHHLNRDIFHSCRIVEVVGAVRTIQEKFSPPNLHLAGFSLGGNFALRVAAHASNAGIRLGKAIGISPVLIPSNTLAALESGWFVYEKYFIRKWKNSLRIKQKVFPDAYDFTDILRMTNLKEMTDLLVRRHSEFADIETYLDGYSIAGDRLANLDSECHAVLAADDPIIPVRDCERLAKSKHLSVTIAPHGGHCGFFDSFNSASWADRRVGEILAEEIKQLVGSS